MSKVELIDISPKLLSTTAVFPGDRPFLREVSMSFSEGQHLGLSGISTTVHVGAHADAPNHYHPEGVGIDQVDLRRYMGLAQVIHVQGLKKGQRILVADIQEPISAKRVLFRTDSFPNPNQWNNDFNSLSPELILHLAKAGVVLVGIDTPSVDPADSKKLESHQELWRTKMSVLEGLDLKHVKPGLYGLSALPLPIADGDASPVRAVLINSPQFFPELL